MQQGMQLIRVTGMDGAEAYRMPPNTFAYNAGPSPFCGNGCRSVANI